MSGLYNRFHGQKNSSNNIFANKSKAGVLDQNVFNNMFRPMEGNANLAKEFMHHAKDIRDAIAHTIFDNRQELNAAISFLARCVEFGDEDGLTELELLLDGKPAIGGINRWQGLMGGTGIMVPSAIPSRRTINPKVEEKAQ